MNEFELNINPFDEFNKGWALVSAGEEGHFNMMTVSWGSLGVLWNKNVCTVYVKPCRYTHEFLRKYDHFTVSFFPEEYRKDLAYLGGVSGREEDKLSKTALTPVFIDDYICYRESRRTMFCKKLYSAPFLAEEVPQDVHDTYYTGEGEHWLFIGEVEDII